MLISELDAVNLIRGSVGVAPVSSLQTQNPDVLAARLRLKTSVKELQTRSWWFNSDYGMNLTPDQDGNIVYPSNAIEVRPLDPFDYLIVRGTRLYDPTRQSFVFNAPVKCNILIALDFVDLPFPAANYAQYMAARKFQADFDGDPGRIADLRADEEMARAALNEAELRNRRTNTLLNAGSLRLNSRIAPYGYSRPRFKPGG